MTSSRRSLARGASVLAIALAATIAASISACNGEKAQPDAVQSQAIQDQGKGQPGQATPAPVWGDSFVALATDSARRTFLRTRLFAYGNSLTYDTADGAGDDQRVMKGAFPGGHHGPRLRIEPAIGTENLTDGDYARGRIIARIRAISRDSTYPKVGVDSAARDTLLYWFVYRQGNQWRSAIIRPNATGRWLPTGLTSHGEGTWRQPLARWRWSEQDEGMWANCTSMRCCSIDDQQYAAAQAL